MPKKSAFGFKFNKKDPNAIAWAEEHAAELVTGVTDTTRESIRETITQVLEGELSWKEASADLMDIFDDPARVRMISRTESMRAVTEGQRELWNQAIEEGILTGDEQQVWIVTPDDKLCPECEAMDGATTPLGESFEGADGPPLHPSCRCTIGLIP
jgi:SPP1 gp7 family putative phage head morphogenesis protein